MASAHDTLPSRGQPSRSNRKKQEHSRRRRGNSRGKHQSKGQQNNQMTATAHTEQCSQKSGFGHHGGVPPVPPSSAVAHFPWHTLRCLSQPWRKPERAPARHVPHWRRTSRPWYSTSRASATSTAGGKHDNLTTLSSLRLAHRSPPTCLDRCLACRFCAENVVKYIQSTMRHNRHLLLRGAHGLLRRLLQSQCHRPATGACASSTASLSKGTGAYTLSAAPPATGACALSAALSGQGTGVCALSATPPATRACASNPAPFSQGTGACALSAASPATGTRASSITPLSYGIISATGSCASCAVPISLGTGGRAPSAAPPSDAQRSSQPAAPVSCSFQRGCPTPPPPGHTVAVGLSCGKADTEAPK